MRSPLLIILCLVALSIGAEAQQNFKRLDSVLTILANEQLFHGQVLISENGVAKFSESFGVTKEGKPITNITPIDIQSVAKGITALSVMILYDQGKLNINDPLEKYFPTLRYPGVQIKHILNHTSGLPRFFQMVFENWPHDQFITTKQMVELASNLKPEAQSKPGELEAYNQTAYMLLASIVEQVTGKSFEFFVRKNIFEPAEMKNTFFYTEDANFRNNLGEANLDNMFSLMLGDGNIESTAEDLNRLDRAIRSGLLLNVKTMAQSYVPPTLLNGKEGRYGYGGSLVEKSIGKRQFQHIGQGTNSNAVFTRFIDTGGVLVVLHEQSVQYAQPVYVAVKNIWENKPYVLPKKRIVHKLSVELIQKYIGNYGDNGFMHITTEEGKLFIQPDGNPSKVQIIPSSDTTFYFEDEGMSWEIYLDEWKNVIGFGPLGQQKDMMKRQK